MLYMKVFCILLHEQSQFKSSFVYTYTIYVVLLPVAQYATAT